MSKKINFFLNGKHFYTNKNINIPQLLKYFNYKHHLIVLEHNDFLQNQSTWNNQKIFNNDRIEIITIVGGG